MADELHARARYVQESLRARGYDVEVLELPESTRTAADAARAVGCEVAQIAKSIVFRGDDSGMPVLAVVSGDHRVDLRKLSARVGEQLRKANADYVRSVTGFVIGGVPPAGHATTIQTFVDEDLERYASVWAAAGTPRAVFSIATDALVALTGGTVCDLHEDGS